MTLESPSWEHPVVAHNDTNDDGTPAGGWVRMRGGSVIVWQKGPLNLTNPAYMKANGAFIEDVITAAITRLQYHQEGPNACSENLAAIGLLKKAIAKLESRGTRIAAQTST